MMRHIPVHKLRGTVHRLQKGNKLRKSEFCPEKKSITSLLKNNDLMNKLKMLDISNQNVNTGISKYSKTQKKKVSKPKENVGFQR